MANFNANANTEDGVFVFNVGDHVKNKRNGEKGVVTEIVHDVLFFGDALRVKLENQNKSLGIDMVSPETQERYIGLLLPFGFWVKCRDAHEKSQWFGWDDFCSGKLSVRFESDEDQADFLRECGAKHLLWCSGNAASALSYGKEEIAMVSRPNVGYRLSIVGPHKIANKYNWSKRIYVGERQSKAREKNKSDLDWTHEEIQMAKELSRKMLIQIFDEGGCIDFTGCHKGDTAIWANYYTNDNRPGTAGQFVARVKNDDVFNQWIGKCVCLCKATKTPIPSFILDKNKERK